MATDRIVLVVDDDDDSRATLAEAIRRDGYVVVQAEHGRAALEWLLASEREPCAIVLDLAMPVMSGWELLAILKSYHRLASIPVVVYSGREEPAESLRSTNLTYVRKPSIPEKVVELVDVFGLKTATGRWRKPA